MPRPADRSPLSLSLAGLAPGVTPRAAIAWAGERGLSAVQLDAVRPGLRPRDLDRSARRDLAAFLRRHELGFTGLDLWIPPEHFADPARADRAAGATVAALSLAGELAALGGVGAAAVAVTLPAALGDDLRSALAAHAAHVGVVLLDHAWPMASAEPAGGLRQGVDPVRVIAASGDPSVALLSAAGAGCQVRLADSDGARPTPLGAGRLDVASYAAARAVVAPESAVVLDVRGLADADGGVEAAVSAWSAAVQPAG